MRNKRLNARAAMYNHRGIKYFNTSITSITSMYILDNITFGCFVQKPTKGQYISMMYVPGWWVCFTFIVLLY